MAPQAAVVTPSSASKKPSVATLAPDGPLIDSPEAGDTVLQQASVPRLARLGAAPPMSPRLVLRFQSLAGNTAVTTMLRQREGEPPKVQREDLADVPVKGVKLSTSKVSVPTESGLSLKATAQPTNASGVTFTVEKGSVAPTGVTIDAATGAMTIAAGQQGGTVNVKATASDGSFATRSLQIIEKPTAIASTTASSVGGTDYGGHFTHTFSAPSGKSSGLQGENINETFDSLNPKSPFAPFTLDANAVGSHGWDLDSSGTMVGPDNVDIPKSGKDVGKFIASASNPSPKDTLPAGFTMVQHLHAKSFPSGTLDSAAFTDVNHVRTLTAKPSFVVESGKGKVEDDYVGPPAYTKAIATPASVTASPPRPTAPKGGKAPPWNRTKVQVTADVIPTSGAKVFSITGANLGCEVDASSGEVLIGDKPGTITVRVSAGHGTNFDEVKITIAPLPPPVTTPAPAAPKKTDSGDPSDDQTPE